ncbi:MAG: hypothetical protein J6U64_02865 [Alphaproteobacteria bacterium]|nr:hypothetical protein [Alphaproteobacteria bacterium]
MKRFLCLILFLLCGCANMPSSRQMRYQTITTDNLRLAMWVKNPHPDKKLRIYIEGDASSRLFSNHGVVSNPVAFKMAEKDSYPNTVYLSRPCYYIDQDICQEIIWKEGRFMPEIIEEMNKIIERLRKRYRPTEIELIGHDGGGTIALLLATRIKSMPVKVITFAGILNTELYALYREEVFHPESLNPANEVYMLSNIPQVHYIGGKDTVYPNSFSVEFIKKIPNPVSAQLKRVRGANHTNWADFNLQY